MLACIWEIAFIWDSGLCLSFSVRGGGGAGHHCNPFQVAPEASWVCCKRVSRPCIPSGLIVGWTLEHQMFNCFFCALTGQMAES